MRRYFLTDLLTNPPPTTNTNGDTNMNITTDYLVSLGACQDGIDAFLSIFPDGEAELSSDNISKALHADLNVAWLIERINDQKTLAELSQDENDSVREIVARHRNTPADTLAALSKDEHYWVRDAVTKNPTYKGAHYGVATQGNWSTATQGNGSVRVCTWWDGYRWRGCVAEIGDEGSFEPTPGAVRLDPGKTYLFESGKFTEVEK